MRLLKLSLILLISLTNLSYGKIAVKQVLPVKVYIYITDNIYRLDSDIILNIEVNNTSSEPIYFYKSDNKLKNFKINILNLNNASIVEEDRINYKDTEFSKREFALFPDETYKVRINLKDYFTFPEPGRYRIKVEFDPYLTKEEQYAIYISNPVYINLLNTVKQEKEIAYIKELIEREKAKVYTPEGTVKFMLEAKKRHDWKNYFLYQNLDNIILLYDKFKLNYLKASKTMKKELIRRFKEYIKNQKERDIESFQILKVIHDYTKGESTVNCRITYKKPAINKSFIYTFKLKQDGKKWYIDNYDVTSYEKR